MKNIIKIATLASVIGIVGGPSLFAQASGGASSTGSGKTASPESQIYSAKEIHHYASNGGAPTVTTVVPSHYSFKSGQYVLVPRHSTEAPLPHDKYSAPYWMSWTNKESGHWARN